MEAFLKDEISFTSIAAVVEETLNRTPNRTPASVREVLEIDECSRDVARSVVRELSRTSNRVFDTITPLSVRS